MRRFGGALLALLILVAAACSESRPAVKPLVLGAIYPLSGPQAPGGHDELAGLRAALRLAQATGALGSRQVQLRVIDATTPAQAVAAVDRLIDEDHVALIFGTYGSTLAEPAAARADQRKTIYWETGAVSDGVTRNRHYVFRTVATGDNLGRMAVDFTRSVLVPAAGLQPASTRSVIISVDDVYGRSVGDGEAARAAALGMPVVDRIVYNASAFDAGQVADRLAADRADYLWDVSYIDDGVAIWKAVVERNVPLRAAVGTSSAFCTPDFGKRLGAAAVGVFAADKPDDQVSPGALSPDGRSLLAQARAVYASQNSGSSMSIPAVAGFIGGWAVFHEVFPRVADEVTPDKLRVAALQVNVPAGDAINGGGIAFNTGNLADVGQNRLAAAVVGQWQAVGQMKVVWPATYATAQPILR